MNRTHLVVLDFEATCDDKNPPKPQEVIEFPSVLLSWPELALVDEFEAFVRPVHHPQLTDFCRELTGIEQHEVDAAQPFANVLTGHLAWLAKNGLPIVPTHGSELPYALLTCGDWDFRTLFPAQLATAGFAHVPAPYRRWINVKMSFAEWTKSRAGSMVEMLEALNLELEGRHHRGIDDSRNIAKIVRALAQNGAALEVTSELSSSRYPPVRLVLCRDGQEAEILLKKRKLSTLLGLAGEAFKRRAWRVFLVGDDTPLDEAALLELHHDTKLRIG